MGTLNLIIPERGIVLLPELVVVVTQNPSRFPYPSTRGENVWVAGL